MKNIIILPKEIAVDDNLNNVLLFPSRNKVRINKLIRKLSVEKLNMKQACISSGVSKTSVYRMYQYYNTAVEFCDMNGIDWELTDYKDLIECVIRIEEAVIEKVSTLKSSAYKLTEEVIEKDSSGKVIYTRKAEPSMIKYLLETTDSENYMMKNNESSVNVNLNMNANQGVTFDLPSMTDIEAFGIETQQELTEITRQKNK